MFIERGRPGGDSVEDEKSSWSLASDFRGLYRSFGDQYRWGPEQAKCLRPFRCNSEGYVEFFLNENIAFVDNPEYSKPQRLRMSFEVAGSDVEPPPLIVHRRLGTKQMRMVHPSQCNPLVGQKLVALRGFAL